MLVEKIVKKSDGYYVQSEKGKNLGGPYKEIEDAKKRLNQVEYFKNKKKIDEEDTSKQTTRNKKLKRDIVRLAKQNGFEGIVNTKELTVHHIDDSKNEDGLKDNSYKNLWFIKSENWKDRELLHKVLHFMDRNNVSYDALLNRLEDIKLYQYDETTNSFKEKTLSVFKESLKESNQNQHNKRGMNEYMTNDYKPTRSDIFGKFKRKVDEDVDPISTIISLLKNKPYTDEVDTEVGDWEVSRWKTNPRRDFPYGSVIIQLDNRKLNKHLYAGDIESEIEYDYKVNHIIDKLKSTVSLESLEEKVVLDDFIEFLKKKGISDPRELTAKEYADNVKEFRGELEKSDDKKTESVKRKVNKERALGMSKKSINVNESIWSEMEKQSRDHQKRIDSLKVGKKTYKVSTRKNSYTIKADNEEDAYRKVSILSQVKGWYNDYKDGNYWVVEKNHKENESIVNEAKAPFENPNFDKEKFGKYFDDENKLIPELTSEYFAAVSADKAEKFNAERFEKRIPYEMRFKEYIVLPDGTLYWICQGFFDESDLKTFKDALATTNLTKAFVTSRDVSTYDYDMDEKYEVGATIDLENNLMDYENYRAATANEEEE